MSLTLPKTTATYDASHGNSITLYHDASENQEGNAGAFADIEKALQEAQHFIFIADWSFHPYMRLKHHASPEKDVEESATIGALLLNKACSKGVVVAIHTWDHTNVGMPDWQNDNGDVLLGFLAKRLGFTKDVKRPSNLLWRASSRTGLGWSHHQKFIVVDAPGPSGLADFPDGRRVLKVFFGGLDLTKGRFDWPGHPILPSEPESTEFLQQLKAMPLLERAKNDDEIRYQDMTDKEMVQNLSEHKYDDWYNAEFRNREKDNRGMVRQPWHDIHAKLVGPAAWDFVREFVGRWNLDPSKSSGAQGDVDSASLQKVLSVFRNLFERSIYVQQWEPHPGKWQAQVLRSMPKEHWGVKGSFESPYKHGTRAEFIWRLKDKTESSIQAAYIKAINEAERFIYIETQYLIGSGKYWPPGQRKTVRNRIPETIVERIIARHKDGKPFHVYIVLPMFPEGDPIGLAGLVQRQFEWATIAAMVRMLHARGVGDVWKRYLSFYFLANWHAKSKAAPLSLSGSRAQLVQANQRYMIYVHSKLMIVDDCNLILGSANLNERSLAGDRDTEIAVGLWPIADPEVQKECVQQVQEFRRGLWQEHLGNSLPAKWQEPESIECVQAVQQTGQQNYINFRLRETPGDSGHLCKWPLEATPGGGQYGIHFSSGNPKLRALDHYLPDSVIKQGPASQWYAWHWIPVGTFGSSMTRATDLAE